MNTPCHNEIRHASLKTRSSERGNALIYVLIAIALFAALTLTLGRQTDTSETGALSEDKAEIIATQLMSYAAQAKAAVDQMQFTGTQIDDLVFTLPGAPTFETGSGVDKVYHPQGGGLSPGFLSSEAQGPTAAIVPAGWYMGRFNNTEWSPGTDQDVILAAYQVAQPVCEIINKRITGSTTIPAIGGATNLHNLFVDPAIHSAGGAADLNVANCAGCEDYLSLCAGKNGVYVFYNVIAIQ